MKISDEILVQQAQQGNERAFNQLVQRYQERIINICFRIIGDFQDAEEAAIDTFLACYRSLGTFEGRSSFATWLYRIATRSAYKRKVRRPPESIPIDGLEIPENRSTTRQDGHLREQEIKDRRDSGVSDWYRWFTNQCCPPTVAAETQALD